VALERDQVGHRLRRVVDVALEVHEGGALVEDPLVEALLHGPRDLAHVGVALAEVHVVPDADDLGHERDHVGRLAHGLPVRDLGLALVKVGEAEAERLDRGGEAEPRPGGVVAEDRYREPRLEGAQRAARPVQLAEDLGDERERAYLGVGLLPREEEIPAEGVGFEGGELGEAVLYGVHRRASCAGAGAPR
jgi:hypothetical protein